MSLHALHAKSNLILAVTAFTVTAALFVDHQHRQEESLWSRFWNFWRPKQQQQQPKKQLSLQPLTEQAFLESVDASRTLHHLDTNEQLVLYGLYKQVYHGDAPKHMEQYGWNPLESMAKHEAWSKCRGMTAEQAAGHYILAVHQLECAAGASSNGLRVDTGGLGHAVSQPMEDDNDDPTTIEDELLLAASRNDYEGLELLLKAGVPADQRDESGQTALHLAADKGAIDCMELLLKHGADVNAADHDGISVLQAAVIAGHVDACRMLLHNGANPNQADADGDTPRSCAQDDGSHTIKEMFGFESQ